MRQARYVLSAQNSDGGFPDRQGRSDLYYTSFALRAATLLDVGNPKLWRRADFYLRTCFQDMTDIVDCFSFLHVKRLLDNLDCKSLPNEAECKMYCEGILNRFRASKGGYARSENSPTSLYSTFLAALCYELLNEKMPETERIISAVHYRRRADGGFSDLGMTSHGETNPTAAAIGLLKMFDALDEEISYATTDFIVTMQRSDGGFAAHDAAPASDLLSTFTALVTLAALDSTHRADLSAIARFVRDLSAQTGGFRATLLDGTPDVEYTYYGLGTLGLLALEVACPRAGCGCEA